MILRRPVLAVLVGLVVASCSGDDVARDESGPTRYLAFGDSISAGSGAPPYDAESERCFRSRRAWPVVLDEQLDDVYLTEFRACGGARTTHLVNPWTEIGLDAQVPVEPDPGVTLVTVTVGANDIGLGALLLICAADCSNATPEAAANFRAALATLRSSLVADVYPALRIAFPEARILHVGYPRLVTRGAAVDCPWLAPDEQNVVERATGELNDTIERAVAQFNDDAVRFVDIADALDGHELCSADPWVVPLDGIDGGHPDKDGYRAIAGTVRKSLEDESP